MLEAGADLAPRRRCLTFAFVERLTSTGRRVASPHFLPMAEGPSSPWQVGEGHRMDLALLSECLTQAAPWKERYGFPAGVRRVLTANESALEGAWQHVIVDRPERLAIALVAGSDQTLRGFAAEADGWQLHDEAPVLELVATAREALPELAVAPGSWEEAWRLWCRQRHLPQSEADACRLTCDGIYLNVEAPESFVQRLRQAKSDLVREDSALLTGDGYLRAAALLRLRAA